MQQSNEYMGDYVSGADVQFSTRLSGIKYSSMKGQDFRDVSSSSQVAGLKSRGVVDKKNACQYRPGTQGCAQGGDKTNTLDAQLHTARLARAAGLQNTTVLYEKALQDKQRRNTERRISSGKIHMAYMSA